MKEKKIDNYIIGLDIIRIISAFMIFAFHARHFLNLSYGQADLLISRGAIFVSVFFMLSGFSLFLSNSKRNLMKIEETIKFYKHRFVNIVPLFALTWIVYCILDTKSPLDTADVIRLLPFELSGLRCELLYLPQMNFFWFISCLMMGYLIFPFIQELIKQVDLKQIVGLIVIIYTILIYATYLEVHFETSAMTYYVPFFRILEMCEGALCCRLMLLLDEMFDKQKSYFKIKRVTLVVSLLAFCIFYKLFPLYANRYMWYDIFSIPCMCLILISINVLHINNIVIKKVILGTSAITYEIYLLQTWIFALFGEYGNGYFFFNKMKNSQRCLFSGIVCIGMSFVVNKLFGVARKLWKRDA